MPFFVNDNVDVAIKCHADGVHVGQEDMTASKVREKIGGDMMLGVSVHTVEEALEAVKSGADCLGVGAMFSTSTKADADVLPKETLRDICAAVDIPVVAIGGISESNIMQLSGTALTELRSSAPFSERKISRASAERSGPCPKTWCVHEDKGRDIRF